MTETAAAEVFTLMVDLGRTPGDGLPDDCDGAALLCYCAARTEQEAVNETVKILHDAGMAPLEVQSYGPLAAREEEGQDITDEDRALMRRALEENAVIVAQMVPFSEDEDDGDEAGDDGHTHGDPAR